MSKINDIINKPELKNPENLNYLEYLVDNFKTSKIRKNHITGVNYYEGKHDILNKKRTIIGKKGELEEVKNIPNNIRIDNQYAIAVDKKTNYLLGKQPMITSDNDDFNNELNLIFNYKFHRIFKNLFKDCLNCSMGYLYLYIKDNELKFKKLKSTEVYPVWVDDEHNELDFIIRLYNKTDFLNGKENINEYVEVYKKSGISRYKLKGNTLLHIEDEAYITDNKGLAYGWGNKLPVIVFKYNSDEIPLINKVKSLQDGINEIISTFNDNMSENPRNSILIIQNYDGQELDEFRHNLNTYGAVKVRNDGGVSALHVEVNSENYRSMLEIFKNALIENAKSFDAKDDRLSGNPNMMNIQSMYSDIDIDSNGIETEFKASFEDMIEVVKMYLYEIKHKNFDNDSVELTFNKDVLINESQVINDIRNSIGIISKESLIENHPFITNPQKELKRIKSERDDFINNELLLGDDLDE